MDKSRRKELLAEYKNIKTYMGVFQIKNNTNNKIYIGTCPNLKNRWLTQKIQLEAGRHINAGLQKDWNQCSANAFTYEVIDQKEAGKIIDKKWELKKMEREWLEKLQPYGNNGYNKPPKD